jgi:predicted RNA methylase
VTGLLPGVDTLPPEALRQKALSQWWTPRAVADRLALWCGDPSSIHSVLEPAAGGGALVAALCRRSPTLAVDAIEIDPRHLDALRDATLGEGFFGVNPECSDYLARRAPEVPYDLAILNPPYEDGADSRFVAKAMDESLRVVALVRLAMLETQRAHERVWSRLGGPEGWRMAGLATFVSRPTFLAPGATSTGGMTAFAAVKLTRVAPFDGVVAGTAVEWWTA